MLDRKLILILGVIFLLSLVLALGFNSSVISKYKISFDKEIKKSNIELESKEIFSKEKELLKNRDYLEEQVYQDLVNYYCYDFYQNENKELIIEINPNGYYCVSKEYLDKITNNKFKDKLEILK